ncbi:transglutaminase domain-containing protein [Actinoplanes sp. NPDC051494]|uniref:transglutaminase family protein n=1 Tax=Actinoplanes sp. NPDC051494 TaxID=3363907 RepID=UPI0037B0F53E
MDLDSAERIEFRVEQSFRYSYDAPVTSLAQRLVVVPRRRHGDLYRRTHRLEVLGAEHVRRSRVDAAGNTVVRVSAAWVERAVEFRLTATLDRVVGDGPPILPPDASADPRFRRPTRLTTADQAIRELADRCAGGDSEEMAERACMLTHAALTYEYGVTNVSTTAAEALAAGRGVCQDFAHVMLAACRALGIASRYVSGHLVGQGGTHAWVEVLVPRSGAVVALAFDPCHGRRAGNGYLTVALGRDYAEVAPTSGTYVGAPGGNLTGSRKVTVANLM